MSLDAHGTLIELPSPAESLRRQLEQRFGAQVSAAEVRTAFGAEVRYYRAHMPEGRDAATLTALRHDCAEVLRAALPPSAALAAAPTAALADALLESLHFRTFPDVLPTLRALRAAGVRLAVASNWDASLTELLARLGVAELLDGVATSAGTGASKPDPAVVAAALAFMDAAPAEAVHVGDVYEEDVLGAQAAGVRPVLLVRDGASGRAGRLPSNGSRGVDPPPAEVAVIHSLAELPALLGLGAAPS